MSEYERNACTTCLLANSTDYLIRSQRVRNRGARNMMTTVFSLRFSSFFFAHSLSLSQRTCLFFLCAACSRYACQLVFCLCCRKPSFKLITLTIIVQAHFLESYECVMNIEHTKFEVDSGFFCAHFSNRFGRFINELLLTQLN